MIEHGGNLPLEPITRTAPKPTEFNWDSVPEYKDEEPPVHAPAMKPVTDLRTGYKPLSELAESEEFAESEESAQQFPDGARQMFGSIVGDKVETPKKDTSGVQQMFKDTRESAPKIAEQARKTNESRVEKATETIELAEAGAATAKPDLVEISFGFTHFGIPKDISETALDELLKKIEDEIFRLQNILETGDIRDLHLPENNALIARFEVIERQIKPNLDLLNRSRNMIDDRLIDLRKTEADRRDDKIVKEYQRIRQEMIDDSTPPEEFTKHVMRNIVRQIAALRVDFGEGRTPTQNSPDSAGSAPSATLPAEPPVDDVEATQRNGVVTDDILRQLQESEPPVEAGDTAVHPVEASPQNKTYDELLAEAKREIAEIMDVKGELTLPEHLRLAEELAQLRQAAQQQTAASQRQIPNEGVTQTALAQTTEPTIPLPPNLQRDNHGEIVPPLPQPLAEQEPTNGSGKKKSILTRALNRLRIRRKKPTPDSALPAMESPIPITVTVETRTPEQAVTNVLAKAGLSQELIGIAAKKKPEDFPSLPQQERQILQRARDLKRVLIVMKDRRDKKPVKAGTLPQGLLDTNSRGFGIRTYLAVRGEIRNSAKLAGMSESELIGKVIDALPIELPPEIKLRNKSGVV